MQHMDQGFRKNSEEFTVNLIKTLNHIIDPQLHEYDVFIDAVIAAAQGFTPLGPPSHAPLGCSLAPISWTKRR